MPYSPTDGFLRRGADQRAARNPSDGLLFIFGPDGGAPPVITDSGTVTTTAVLSGVEAIADGGAVVSVGGATGNASLADSGLVLSVAILEGVGVVIPGTVIDPRLTREGWAAVRDPGMLGGWNGTTARTGEGRILRVTSGRVRSSEEP